MALFASQEPVLARLRAGDLGLANITQAASLDDMLASAQTDRSLYLILGPYAPEPEVGGTRAWREIWVLVLALKVVGKSDNLESLRHAAAPYINEIVGLLDQWRDAPASGDPAWLGPIDFVEGPRPMIRDGFGYFPLAYQVKSCTESRF